ncbi:MAG: hypothetical protein WKF33_01430 [Thermoleophilaceae bacterium]
MAKRTKAEERRRRKLEGILEHRPYDEITRLWEINVAWARRRSVEGRYHHAGRGEVREPMDVFDLWTEDRPGEPPREPDGTYATASAAVDRLAQYQQWIDDSR